jgi:hypothetical protein
MGEKLLTYCHLDMDNICCPQCGEENVYGTLSPYHKGNQTQSGMLEKNKAEIWERRLREWGRERRRGNSWHGQRACGRRAPSLSEELRGGQAGWEWFGMSWCQWGLPTWDPLVLAKVFVPFSESSGQPWKRVRQRCGIIRCGCQIGHPNLKKSRWQRGLSQTSHQPPASLFTSSLFLSQRCSGLSLGGCLQQLG